MALPSSGPLSLNDIAGEFGGATPHSLSEYYAGGGLVPSGTSGTYGAVPSSGTISIQNFYGTSNVTYWLGWLGDNSALTYNVSPRGVKTDSSGNVYTLSVVFIDSVGTFFVIAKFNATGAIQWQYRFATHDFGGGIDLDSSGNLYFGGDASVGDIVIKFNSSGTIQWQTRITNGGPNIQNIHVDSSGNVYVVGTNARIAKFNSSGVGQWGRELSSGGDYYGAVTDSSGNIYVFGRIVYSGWYAYLTVKYDSSGTLQWQRVLHNSGSRNLNGTGSIAIDSSSNVYVTGWAESPTQALTVKYDTNGTLQWQVVYSVGQGSYIASETSGNTYISGSDGSSIGLYIKYNSSGTLQWQRTYSISGQNFNSVARNTVTSGVLYGYGSGAAGIYNRTAGSINKLPVDGSKTGSYTVGGYTNTYSAASNSSSTSSFSAVTPSYTSSATSLSTATPANTTTSTTIPYSSTTI